MREAPRPGVNAAHFGVQVASTEDVAGAWSRFEAAGLHYAEEHPDEVLDVIEDKTEALIRELEAKHREETRAARGLRRKRAPRYPEQVSSVPF